MCREGRRCSRECVSCAPPSRRPPRCRVRTGPTLRRASPTGRAAALPGRRRWLRSRRRCSSSRAGSRAGAGWASSSPSGRSRSGTRCTRVVARGSTRRSSSLARLCAQTSPPAKPSTRSAGTRRRRHICSRRLARRRRLPRPSRGASRRRRCTRCRDWRRRWPGTQRRGRSRTPKEQGPSR
uniref:Uncharacterized protein n=1 Tax=Emiliania huxleyi (strain CCMP1516) TaxID=280463 RepID=A0A0D3I9V2_EMIH1